QPCPRPGLLGREPSARTNGGGRIWHPFEDEQSALIVTFELALMDRNSRAHSDEPRCENCVDSRRIHARFTDAQRARLAKSQNSTHRVESRRGPRGSMSDRGFFPRLCGNFSGIGLALFQQSPAIARDGKEIGWALRPSRTIWPRVRGNAGIVPGMTG